MNITDVYAEKKRFVDLLSEAYELDRTVDRIIYTIDRDRHLELVHIEYPGGHLERINVTGNSHTAIGREIANQVSGINAVGFIR